LAHFRPLSANWAFKYATAYLSVVSDHVHPFTTTMYPSFRIMHHVTKLISLQIGFLDMPMSWTCKMTPTTTRSLKPIEHLWDVVEWEIRALDVHPTNLHQLQDDILSILANISKECVQYLVELMPRRIKAVLKEKRGSNCHLVVLS